MNASKSIPSRFRYLRDPLFIACVALYFVNRLVVKRLIPDGFVHDHFNDLICIPFWVPIMLWLQRSVGLRPVPVIPSASEIFIPLVVWSLVFEFWLPATQTFSGYSTGDYRDIVWYTVGALLAACWWSWWYRAPEKEPKGIEQKVTKGTKRRDALVDAST